MQEGSGPVSRSSNADKPQSEGGDHASSAESAGGGQKQQLDRNAQALAALQETPTPVLMIFEFLTVCLMSIVGLTILRWVFRIMPTLQPVLIVLVVAFAIFLACNTFVTSWSAGRSLVEILIYTDFLIVLMFGFGVIVPDGSPFTPQRISCAIGAAGVMVASSNRQAAKRRQTAQNSRQRPGGGNPNAGPPFCEACGLYLDWTEKSYGT